MSITGAVGSSGYTQGIKRPNLDQWISQMDTSGDGQISKTEYDAVTSATNKGGYTGGPPKLSFEQLSGGSDSISTSDLKAILEKMRPAGGGHHRPESVSDAASGATTKSTTSAYQADATTGATASSASSPAGSDNRLSLILDLLSQNSSTKTSYTAEDMKTFLSLMNGINTSA